MSKWLTYCAERKLLDCSFPVFYKLENYGSGPNFIESIYSSKSFLEEHEDCKSVLEVCCGPGYVGWYLYNKLKLDTIHFIDIHEPVLEDIKKTKIRQILRTLFSYRNTIRWRQGSYYK